MPVLVPRRGLESLPEPVCPAASPIRGNGPMTVGVVCRVMESDRQQASGLDVNPAQLAVQRGGPDGVFLRAAKDPSTIERLCCGTGIPGARGGYYTACPVWRAWKEQGWEGRGRLVVEDEAPERTEWHATAPVEESDA